MISKTELRKQLIEKRKTLDTKKLSKILCEKILNLKEYQNAKNIFAYCPMKYEVDIFSLFEDKNKNWFLPRVQNKDMIFVKYAIGDKLIKSEFGVFEPIGNKTDITPDLIIVPALSADKNGYRIGYGKGYYDRFLSSQNCATISPVFFDLMVEEWPVERHDRKIDIIIS